MSKFRLTFVALVVAAAPASSLFAADIAWLVKTEGPVEVAAPSGTATLNTPMQLLPGSTVKTGNGATAVLQMRDGSHIQVGANSTFAFAEATDKDTVFDLSLGQAYFWIRHLKHRRMQVRSPGAVAAVRGTEFGVSTDGHTSQWDLYKGRLDILDTVHNNTTRLHEGHRAIASAAMGISRAAVTALEPKTAAPAEPPASSLPAPAPQPAPVPAPAPTQAPAPAPAPVSPPPAQQQQQTISPSAPH